MRHPEEISQVKLLPWLLCTFGITAQLRHMIFTGFQQTHGGLGDARLVNFTLEHGYRWLRQISPHEDFWAAPIFYPYERSSAFTDTVLGFAPIYWIPRILGAAPDTALQWWIVSVYILNFFASYLLARVGLRLGIFSASFFALFISTCALDYSGHLQLVPFFYVIVGILAVFRIFSAEGNAPGDVERRSWVLVLICCFVLQFWSAVYPFFYFGLFAVICLVIALVIKDSRKAFLETVRKDRVIWAIALTLGAIAAYPLYAEYRLTAETLGYRSFSVSNLPLIYTWLVTGRDDFFFADLTKGGYFKHIKESRGIGVVAFCFAAYGYAISTKKVSTRVLVPATLAIIVLGTNFFGFSLWEFVHKNVPGAGAIRAQGRISLILVPIAGIGIAIAASHLATKGKAVFALVVLAVCLTENFSTLRTIDKQFVRNYIDNIAKLVDPKYDAFVLVPAELPVYKYADDAAWVTLSTGIPTVNGRYGNFPKEYNLRNYDREKSVTPENFHSVIDADLQHWLDRRNVRRDRIQWIEYKSLTSEIAKQHRMR